MNRQAVYLNFTHTVFTDKCTSNQAEPWRNHSYCKTTNQETKLHCIDTEFILESLKRLCAGRRKFLIPLSSGTVLQLFVVSLSLLLGSCWERERETRAGDEMRCLMDLNKASLFCSTLSKLQQGLFEVDRRRDQQFCLLAGKCGRKFGATDDKWTTKAICNVNLPWSCALQLWECLPFESKGFFFFFAAVSWTSQVNRLWWYNESRSF